MQQALKNNNGQKRADYPNVTIKKVSELLVPFTTSEPNFNFEWYNLKHFKMEKLELNMMESLNGGLDCDTQMGLGFGLLVGGLLLGFLTFGIGTAIAVAGYGIGWDGVQDCANQNS